MNLPSLTFAVTYETDESYMLWTCLKASDTSAKVGYRYNLHTDSWTEWQISKTCAVLNLCNKSFFPQVKKFKVSFSILGLMSLKWPCDYKERLIFFTI